MSSLVVAAPALKLKVMLQAVIRVFAAVPPWSVA